MIFPVYSTLTAAPGDCRRACRHFVRQWPRDSRIFRLRWRSGLQQFSAVSNRSRRRFVPFCASHSPRLANFGRRAFSSSAAHSAIDRDTGAFHFVPHTLYNPPILLKGASGSSAAQSAIDQDTGCFLSVPRALYDSPIVLGGHFAAMQEDSLNCV